MKLFLLTITSSEKIEFQCHCCAHYQQKKNKEIIKLFYYKITTTVTVQIMCVCVYKCMLFFGTFLHNRYYEKINFVITLLLYNKYTHTHTLIYEKICIKKQQQQQKMQKNKQKQQMKGNMFKIFLLPAWNTMRYSSDLRCMRCLLLKVDSCDIIPICKQWTNLIPQVF